MVNPNVANVIVEINHINKNSVLLRKHFGLELVFSNVKENCDKFTALNF